MKEETLRINMIYIILMRFRCFFHNLIVPPRTTEEEILQLFSDIENETQEESPFYSIQSGYKSC
jgi:hypothetical protein